MNNASLIDLFVAVDAEIWDNTLKKYLSQLVKLKNIYYY